MNILFYLGVSVNSVHGGIANVSRWLGNAFENRGHQVFYLSTRETATTQVNNQFYLPNSNNIFSEQNESFFRGIIDRYHIDIVINQNGTTPMRYEAAKWAHEYNIPVVTVVHNSLEGIYGDHRLLKKIGIPSAIRKKISMRLFHWKYDRFIRKYSLLSDRVITLSERFFDELMSFAGYDQKNKLVAIPNPLTQSGCDTYPQKENEVLYVGRLSEEKQVPLLLEVWAKVEPANPDWRLTIVGDGNESERCIQVVHKLNLKRVQFEGYKSDPSPYYRRAQIFCMTSRFEGFGLVLVEAMSNYTVPLAFNTYANVIDIIENNKSGYIIKPYDIEEYAKKIQSLIENADIRKKMAHEAKIQSGKFSMDCIIDRWEKVFKEIISV